MTDSPWSEFEAAVKDRDYLPPLRLGKQNFRFPISPPAIVFFLMSQYEKDHDGNAMPNTLVASEVITEIVDKETWGRLMREITLGELDHFIVSLFKAWGWFAEGEVNQGNRKARRASTKTSSRGSARSKQTSPATTG